MLIVFIYARTVLDTRHFYVIDSQTLTLCLPLLDHIATDHYVTVRHTACLLELKAHSCASLVNLYLTVPGQNVLICIFQEYFTNCSCIAFFFQGLKNVTSCDIF